MAEYIDRAEYCEKHCRCNNEYCDKESCPIWKAPAADVAPVVHGYWIRNSLFSNELCNVSSCSQCGELVEFLINPPRYCPNCGARMDGADG